MADIIDITGRLKGRDNLVERLPLEFRRGEWHNSSALMCTRRESEKFEAHRLEMLSVQGGHLAQVPSHFVLDGGCHFTIGGLFRYRGDEVAMRRVYRLAGMMECVTNAPSSVLRSDLLRRFYETILEERNALAMVWRGNVRHFLLPMHPDFRNPNLFLHNISRAESLKDLYDIIEAETDTQFDIICASYVVYVPETFLPER